MQKVLQKVLNFHKNALNKFNFPCQLSIPALKNSLGQKGIFLPSTINPELFLSFNNKRFFLPFLEYPVIKNLTLFKKITKTTDKLLINYLQLRADKCLFLVESYNKPAIYLVSRLNPFETYYCLQKFFCYIKDIKFKKNTLDKKIRIRNFDIKTDKLSYARYYNKILGYLGSPVDKGFMDEIISRHSFDPEGYFIAEHKNKIIGFLAVEKEPWGEPGNKFGYIYQIGVDINYRGKGLAAVLLKQAVRFCLKNGISKLVASVRKNNLPAVNFFMKHGLHQVFEIKGYLVDFKFLNKLNKFT